MKHLRRWGALYILLVLWLGSAVGQFVAQTAEGDGWLLFASATFENWQSEFLQLTVQALLIVVLADKVFKAGQKNTDVIKEKLDIALSNQVYIADRIEELKDKT